MKNENGGLLADSHIILNRWKNYFSQLLNVHRASDVRRIEIHTAEPVVPDPSFYVLQSGFSTLKMEATCSSETSVAFLRVSWLYIPADITLQLPLYSL
jgi:hypothetical protein